MFCLVSLAARRCCGSLSLGCRDVRRFVFTPPECFRSLWLYRCSPGSPRGTWFLLRYTTSRSAWVAPVSLLPALHVRAFRAVPFRSAPQSPGTAHTSRPLRGFPCLLHVFRLLQACSALFPRRGSVWTYLRFYSNFMPKSFALGYPYFVFCQTILQ